MLIYYFRMVTEQLRELEENGIDLEVNGEKIHLPVILHSISSDNLGLHQMCGLQRSFTNGRCCRNCNGIGPELRSNSTLESFTERTPEDYNEVVLKFILKLTQFLDY